ncbi:MAG: hypothetical protein HDS70_00420 [Bacteroidales bacterium]|nr:hypothetical protein [Bacteroidales bacterium]MBD5217915.1 hypothetical protein [Bacteroidales bacterium]MBD5220823.1 hypothetical protein [Bacteroidales bacterium]
MGKVRKLGHKILTSDGWFYEFLRSAVSSQTAGWMDLGCRFVFYSYVFVGLSEFYRSNLSVAIGAVVGGIVNCAINYKFTFHASGQNIAAVAVKYILVWAGSLLLNMYGTTFAFLALSDWHWLREFGLDDKLIFSGATLLVALIVSWAWNFVLQRNFVYRPNRFDPYFIRLVHWLVPRRKSCRRS